MTTKPKQDGTEVRSPDNEIYSIYTLRYPLSHPRHTQVFYVGMAADPYRRFIQHLQLEGGNEAKTALLRELRELRTLPIMQVEASVEGKAFAEAFEAFFIEYYRAAKQPLVNKALSLSPLAEKGRETFFNEVDMLSFLISHRPLFQQWKVGMCLLFLPFGRRAREERAERTLRTRLHRMFEEYHRCPYFRPINPYHLVITPGEKVMTILGCVRCKAPLVQVDAQGHWQKLTCSCRSEEI